MPMGEIKKETGGFGKFVLAVVRFISTVLIMCVGGIILLFILWLLFSEIYLLITGETIGLF